MSELISAKFETKNIGFFDFSYLSPNEILLLESFRKTSSKVKRKKIEIVKNNFKKSIDEYLNYRGTK